MPPHLHFLSPLLLPSPNSSPCTSPSARVSLRTPSLANLYLRFVFITRTPAAVLIVSTAAPRGALTFSACTRARAPCSAERRLRAVEGNPVSAGDSGLGKEACRGPSGGGASAGLLLGRYLIYHRGGRPPGRRLILKLLHPGTTEGFWRRRAEGGDLDPKAKRWDWGRV